MSREEEGVPFALSLSKGRPERAGHPQQTRRSPRVPSLPFPQPPPSPTLPPCPHPHRPRPVGATLVVALPLSCQCRPICRLFHTPAFSADFPICAAPPAVPPLFRAPFVSYLRPAVPTRDCKTTRKLDPLPARPFERTNRSCAQPRRETTSIQPQSYAELFRARTSRSQARRAKRKTRGTKRNESNGSPLSPCQRVEERGQGDSPRARAPRPSPAPPPRPPRPTQGPRASASACRTGGSAGTPPPRRRPTAG